MLLAGDATQAALDAAERVLFLVGGYDGSGNYGDLAQLQAALALVSRVAVTPVVVIERERAGAHAQLGAFPGVLTAQFTAGPLDGLRPLALAPGTRAAGAYLYGGGYLNAMWGARKLAMLRAAQDAARRTGLELRPLVASGVQADPEYVAGLLPADEALLRRIRPFGVRDAGSLAAAPAATLSGDDALGVLASWAPTAGRAGARRVNVHLNQHDWVTDDPDGLLGFVEDLLVRLDAGPVQPVVAYDDPHVSEVAGVKRLGSAPPVVLRPDTFAQTLPELRDAALTISCSYHVALTSLVLGVPTVLLAGNDYYRQKAAGLAADFPSLCVVDPADGARVPAAEPAAAEDVARAVARRRAVEDELARTIADAMEAGTPPDERLRRQAQAAADAMQELALLRVDHEALRQAGEEEHRRLGELEREVAELRAAAAAKDERILALDARAKAAEEHVAAGDRALAVVHGSLSWRLTRPLRAAGARLRQRRTS